MLYGCVYLTILSEIPPTPPPQPPPPPLSTKMVVSSHASSIKRQVTIRCTGHPRTVGTQHGTGLVTHFGAKNLAMKPRPPAVVYTVFKDHSKLQGKKRIRNAIPQFNMVHTHVTPHCGHCAEVSSSEFKQTEQQDPSCLRVCSCFV